MSWPEEKNQHISDSESTVQSQADSSSEQQDLTACLQEVSECKEAAKRIAADFENFKKRVERDRVLWSQVAQSDVLLNVLPIVDDFDRALNQAQTKECSAELETWLAGFELINKSLYKFLQSFGVTPIEQVTLFDPEFHEAIAQIESPDHASGTIVEVVQKGFMRNDRVLRPARVTVAK